MGAGIAVSAIIPTFAKHNLKKMVNKKPIIAVVVPCNIIVSKFIESGALKSIEDNFDVRYIEGQEVSKNYTGNITKINLSKRTRFFDRYFGRHLWYISLCAYFRARKSSIADSFKLMQQRPIMRNIYWWASSSLIFWLIKWFDENVIFKKDKSIQQYLQVTHPSLIIFPGSALDAYSLMVVRTAKQLGVSTAMIISHWDFFSKKNLLRFSPDKVYVWGEDMRQMALLDETLDENKIEVVGAPHFDRYALTRGDRFLARVRLGITPGSKVILFAGTSVPFDEVAILQRLNRVLEVSQEHSVVIIYRPHPGGWARKSIATQRPSEMRNVIVDQPLNGEYASYDHYLMLLSAIDGLISPFSTMVIEGALCGKPSMCIGFGDGINEWDFSITKNGDHLNRIRNSSWVTACYDIGEVESCFSKFLTELGDGTKESSIKKEVRYIVHYDSNPYNVRLLTRVMNDFFNP